MRHILLFIALISSTFATETNLDIEKFKATHANIAKKQLAVTVDYFQQLCEWGLTLRHDTIATGMTLVKKKENGEVLTGADLEKIQKGVKEHLSFRELMMELIQSTRSALEDDCPGCNFGSTEQLRQKKYLMGIAGAVLLYDNFALGVSIFSDNGELRRLINQGDSGFKIEEDKLKEVMKSYYSVRKRYSMRKALKWYNSNSKNFAKLAKNDQEIGYFIGIIDGSPSVEKIQDGYIARDVAGYFDLFRIRGGDKVASTTNEITNNVSKLFGNSIGIVQTRDGLLKHNREVLKSTLDELKPLDVLLEKTPFRLTDKLIPGYFGHVAIWVGTEQELRDAGLWEHEVIKPYQKDIRKGCCVLEALRDGVQIRQLSHFMDIDDMAILRCNALDKSEKKETTIRCFRQIGKEYDFNFDVETIDKIVCSELVYQTFTSLKWPTEKVLGRMTISPDNVANKAYLKDGFDLVSLYINGKEIPQNKAVKTFEKCLESVQED